MALNNLNFGKKTKNKKEKQKNHKPNRCSYYKTLAQCIKLCFVFLKTEALLFCPLKLDRSF